MAPVVLAIASDVADPLEVVVTTPGTEVSLPGVVVLLLDPQAARPATMLREMDAGTMKRLARDEPFVSRRRRPGHHQDCDPEIVQAALRQTSSRIRGKCRPPV